MFEIGTKNENFYFCVSYTRINYGYYRIVVTFVINCLMLYQIKRKKIFQWKKSLGTKKDEIEKNRRESQIKR